MPESLLKGVGRMGTLIWFAIVAVITAVLERDTFFAWWLRARDGQNR